MFSRTAWMFCSAQSVQNSRLANWHHIASWCWVASPQKLTFLRLFIIELPHFYSIRTPCCLHHRNPSRLLTLKLKGDLHFCHSAWLDLTGGSAAKRKRLEVRSSGDSGWQESSGRKWTGWWMKGGLVNKQQYFSKAISIKFLFGTVTVFMSWIPKHLVINYTVDNDLCCVIFMWWSQHFNPKQYTTFKARFGCVVSVHTSIKNSPNCNCKNVHMVGFCSTDSRQISLSESKQLRMKSTRWWTDQRASNAYRWDVDCTSLWRTALRAHITVCELDY